MKFMLDIRKKFFTQRVVRLSQGSGHGPKPAKVSEAFGQCCQTHGGITGMSCAGTGVWLNDPCGSLPTQDIL